MITQEVGMPRLLRRSSTLDHLTGPTEPRIEDVDSFLLDIWAERQLYRNHSGRMARLTYRCDRLLEGRLVLADRLICQTMEF